MEKRVFKIFGGKPKKISVNEVKGCTWYMWIQSDFPSPVSFGWSDHRNGGQYYTVEFPWVDVATEKIISDEDAVKLYGVNNIREFIVKAVKHVKAYYGRTNEAVDQIAVASQERLAELGIALGDGYDAFIKSNAEYQRDHPELYSGLVIE